MAQWTAGSVKGPPIGLCKIPGAFWVSRGVHEPHEPPLLEALLAETIMEVAGKPPVYRGNWSCKVPHALCFAPLMKNSMETA